MSENSCFRDLSAQVSQIPFLSLFDRFTAYYNCMNWNVRKLISPRFQCTSITYRVLRLFDRFTAFYNCMTWNVRKLIFAQFQCISITTVFFAYMTVLRLITTVWPEMSENSYLRDFSAQVSQIVCIAYLSVLRLLTTLWPEVLKKWYLRNLSEQVSQIVFLANLRILRLFYNWLT